MFLFSLHDLHPCSTAAVTSRILEKFQAVSINRPSVPSSSWPLVCAQWEQWRLFPSTRRWLSSQKKDVRAWGVDVHSRQLGSTRDGALVRRSPPRHRCLGDECPLRWCPLSCRLACRRFQSRPLGPPLVVFPSAHSSHRHTHRRTVQTRTRHTHEESGLERTSARASSRRSSTWLRPKQLVSLCSFAELPRAHSRVHGNFCLCVRAIVPTRLISPASALRLRSQRKRAALSRRDSAQPTLGSARAKKLLARRGSSERAADHGGG